MCFAIKVVVTYLKQCSLFWNLSWYLCRAHKATRCCVERGIGQLKRRFHVLHGEVRATPGKTYKIVAACAMLHNICKARNIGLPPEEDDGQQDDNGLVDGHNPHPFPVPAAAARRRGLIFRDEFVMAHFK